MDLAHFTDKKAGRVLKAQQGYWAFAPNPLPPELTITWKLAKEISQADRALSELAGVARTLPNPHLLIGPFVRREAVSSSRIEGTQASLSDLFFFEASGLETPQAPDVREVENYVRALEYGLKRLKTLPLSLRLIREIHERLMRGVRGGIMTPGEFRTSQNWIGKGGATLMDATFIPPPPIEMKEALGDLEKYMHADSALPALVQLALIHYQFESIHPFLDGNGRVGRLLVTLLLCSQGLLREPLLYLSSFFEKNRDEYYERLLAVSQKGEWEEWITFFLRGIALQSKDAVDRSDKLLELWQSYRKKMQSVRASALPLLLIDALFSSPAITLGLAEKMLKVTPRAAQLNIDKLIKAGILKEATGKQRNRIYVASGIIQIIERSNVS